MILKATRKAIANLRQLSGTDFGAFGFLSINKPGEIDPISVTELYNSYISKPRTDSPCPLLLEREHGGCLAYDEKQNTTRTVPALCFSKESKVGAWPTMRDTIQLRWSLF